jgi:hypothetical protein
MNRSAPLKRKAPLRAKAPERRERVRANLAETVAGLLDRPAERPRAVMALVKPTPAAAVLKTPDRVDHAIRRSAKGEPCLIRLPVCNGSAIWSHNRHGRAGKGGAIKALDLNGCYACSACDAIYDGQAPLPAGYTREKVELAWYHAHAESLVRLRQKGLA